jgi:hypothetical protein
MGFAGSYVSSVAPDRTQGERERHLFTSVFRSQQCLLQSTCSRSTLENILVCFAGQLRSKTESKQEVNNLAESKRGSLRIPPAPANTVPKYTRTRFPETPNRLEHNRLEHTNEIRERSTLGYTHRVLVRNTP